MALIISCCHNAGVVETAALIVEIATLVVIFSKGGAPLDGTAITDDKERMGS